jgi:hypothetical protein
MLAQILPPFVANTAIAIFKYQSLFLAAYAITMLTVE